MQLVAYGAQDIYLTGNPQITFFKVVYRRHTNFSMETIKQTFNGNVASGSTVTATISRNGDLVHKLYLNSISDNIVHGSAIIDNVELEIGGQRIDRHYQEWMNIWNELSTPESKAVALKAMQGDIGTSNDDGVKEMVQIPLQFWFCRNPGLALPLIALQYHEVKVKIKLGSATGFLGAELVADYIYLDTDERRRFAQVSHEYLIEQLQKETFTSGTDKDYSLNFNHPVKELIWTSDRNYTSAQLKLNGHDRFSEQKQEYFMLRQPFDYHTAVPRQNLPPAAQLTGNVMEPETISSLVPITNTVDSNEGNTLTVSSGEIAVVQDATDPGTASTGTTEITLAATLSPTQVGYIVNKDDFATFLQVGRLYEITVDGTEAATGGPVIATLTEKIPGFGSTGFADTSFFLRFDRLLVVGTVAASTVDAFAAPTAGANHFSITRVKQFNPKAELVAQARTSKLTDRINVYSFSLKPEEHQPSGTCNFSRIDNAQLKIKGAPMVSGDFNLYAVNYNVLRIMSGMGGLAYSN